MKKLIIPAIIMVVAMACSDADDPQPAACQPTEIEYFNGFTSTFYYFNTSHNGKNLLSEVSFNPGSAQSIDFAYEYLQGRLSKVAFSLGDITINYAPTFDGDKLTKLSGTPFGFGIVLYEIVVTYNGDKISRWDQYIGDPTTGTLYQFQHYEFTYEGDDMATSKFYLDETVFDALDNNQTPAAYSPELVINAEYGYGMKEAPNPLYMQINLQNPEMSLMQNVPTTIVQRDASGNIVGSLGYEITFNDQGFPTLAQSTSAFIDFTYNCN